MWSVPRTWNRRGMSNGPGPWTVPQTPNVPPPGRSRWEPARRRTPGHDWCIVRLGLPGIIQGVVVDTSHFKGNYPEACSLEACTAGGHPDAERLSAADDWVQLLPKTQLQGHAEN